MIGQRTSERLRNQMENKTPVKSALRTLSLFELFGSQMRALSLSEVSRLLDVPQSSCHGLISTLQDAGYLYSLGGRRTVYPTKRLLDLARVISHHDPVLEHLRPHLEALRDLCEETVILGVRENSSVAYLDVLESNQTIRYSANAGEIKSLHSSAIGKAMLSEIDPSERQKLINSLVLKPVTANTITSVDALIKNIEQGVAQGYFITRSENVSDVTAVAKIAHGAGGVFGVAIAGPIQRMEERLDDHLEKLGNCCARIEASGMSGADVS